MGFCFKLSTEERIMVLEAKYSFIRDDVFLIARVYEGNESIDEVESFYNGRDFTGKQLLIMHKIDLKTGEIEIEDRISCIHTSVMNISAEQFEDLYDDIDFQKDIYNRALDIRSSEQLREIRLSIEEKFKAFKSWVAGIAEVGLKAFEIQDEIDNNLDLMYPIASFLLHFMIKADTKFIPMFLSKIERQCVYNGETHFPSLNANLNILIKIIINNLDDDEENVLYLSEEEIDSIISYILVLSPKFLISCPHLYIREMIAANPFAAKCIEYRSMFSDSNCVVREYVLNNSEASINFPIEYKELILRKEKESIENISSIRLDGFYQKNDKDNDYCQLIRFYSNGDVINVTTTTFDRYIDNVKRWFNRSSQYIGSRGNYVIKGNTIQFTSHSSSGDVKYDGLIISKDIIEFNTHSLINNRKFNGMLFEFIKVPNLSGI